MFRQPAMHDQQIGAKAAPLDSALLILAALYALLPFGRLLLTGEANQVDMGVATILLFLIGGSLLDRRRRVAASSRSQGGSRE